MDLCRVLLPCLAAATLVQAAPPPPFHQLGTLDPGQVQVLSVEGETTRRSLYWHAKPVLARDASGNFYVGNKRTVTKLAPDGTALWKVTHARLDLPPTEFTPGDHTETWDFDQLAGTEFDYDVWNRTESHHSTWGSPDVVDDIDIAEVIPLEHQILVVARVVSGYGPRVILASLSPDGMFHWRQVTSLGSGPPIGKDYLCTHVNEAANSILVTEAGEDLSHLIAAPVSQVTEIALADGNRGSAYTFGYNGSESPQYKNHRILKSILLPDGRLAWIAKCSNDWLETWWQDYHKYRVEIYEHGSGVITSTPFDISTGTPFAAGHVECSVRDIALDGNRLLMLAQFKETLAGPPFHRYDLKVYGTRYVGGPPVPGPLQDLWIFQPPGEEFADRLVVGGGRMTLVGKSDDYLRFPGWMLASHPLNGDSAPSVGWTRSTPFDSPYYRVGGEVRDLAVDSFGSVYLATRLNETNPDFDELLAPTLGYMKYSPAGHLQFFRPLTGFDVEDVSISPSPAQLVIDPDAPESSHHAAYHLFALATTPETAESMVEASTKKWHLLYLEQEANVAAPALDFGAPSTPAPGYGSVVNGTTIRTEGNNLQAVFYTTGNAYRIWFEGLPQGMFFNTGFDSSGYLYGVVSGPITAPYGTYTFTAHASGPHDTVSREFTLQHPAPVPVDVLRPGLALTAPKTTKKPSIQIQGAAGDDIRVASVSYRVKAGKAAFGASRNVSLTAGTILRRFKLTVPTRKKGTYKIEFTVRDTSGKQTVKVHTCTRR